MSYLFQEVRSKSTEQAIPLALAESTLKVIKGLVLGTYIKSDSEEKDLGIACYPIKLEDILKSSEV